MKASRDFWARFKPSQRERQERYAQTILTRHASPYEFWDAFRSTPAPTISVFLNVRLRENGKKSPRAILLLLLINRNFAGFAEAKINIVNQQDNV